MCNDLHIFVRKCVQNLLEQNAIRLCMKTTYSVLYMYQPGATKAVSSHYIPYDAVLQIISSKLAYKHSMIVLDILVNFH